MKNFMPSALARLLNIGRQKVAQNASDLARLHEGLNEAITQIDGVMVSARQVDDTAYQELLQARNRIAERAIQLGYASGDIADAVNELKAVEKMLTKVTGPTEFK